MEQLVLHIGTHKTGTSAIQASLAASDAELRARNALYPVSGRVSAGGHLNLAWEATGDGRFAPGLGTTADLLEEVSASRPECVVISAETFTTRPGKDIFAEWTSDLISELRPIRLLIVGYVRPQWEYIESVYAQQVKQGFITGTFEEFLDAQIAHPRFDYRVVFEPWHRRFGDSLMIRPYRREVVADFWSIAGLGQPPEIVRTNTRPGALEMALLRGIGSWFNNRTARVEACRWARAWLSNQEFEDEAFRALTETSVSRIARRYGPANREFANRYLGEMANGLFDAPPMPDEPQHPELDDAAIHLAHELLAAVATRFTAASS